MLYLLSMSYLFFSIRLTGVKRKSLTTCNQCAFRAFVIVSIREFADILTCRLVIPTCVKWEKSRRWTKVKQLPLMWRMIARIVTLVKDLLTNCYGSSVGPIAVSLRNTELPGTSRRGSLVVSSIDFGNISSRSKLVWNTHNFSNYFEQTCQCKNSGSRKSGWFRGCGVTT